MNILHINYTDLIGGRFTGYYMQDALEDKEYNINMAVWKKEGNNQKVYRIPPLNNYLYNFTNIIMNIGARVGLDRLIGFGGIFIRKQEFFKEADVVHIHIIHNFSNFSIFSFPKLSSLKPLVWTIHDPWAFTGGCEHSFECERWMYGCSPKCPHPRAKSLFMYYMPYLHWKIKKKIYENTDLSIVVASQWMENKVKKSPLLNHFNCTQIPFGIDLNLFRPLSKKECKLKFNIPVNNNVIAFRNSGIKKDKFKGLIWILKALEIYTPIKPTTILMIEDDKGFEIIENKYNIIKVGWIDREDMVSALSSADIFLMPSIQEAFGLMAVEAMACGTPVIVFEGTALPSVIHAPDGGLSVPPKNSYALADAIKLLLEDDNLRNKISIKAREIAEKNYSFDLYIERHLLLYKKVIEKYK